MVATTSNRSGPPQRRKLILLLGMVVEDFDALGRTAHGAASAAGRKSDYSKRALASLARLARTGRQQLQGHLEALGAPPVPEAPLTVEGPENSLNGFILAYRRCGRHLCMAQREAREAADGQTCELLFHLLRDLERQLWLLDRGRGGVPFDSTAGPAVFQYC